MNEYIFTFGCGQKNAGECQVVVAENWDSARKAMFDMYGEKWEFQYSREEWEIMRNDPDRWYPIETELPTELYAEVADG